MTKYTYIIRLATRRVSNNTDNEPIMEYFYCGRYRNTRCITTSNNVECAKRFRTMRGARIALAKIEKDLPRHGKRLEASLITTAEDYRGQPVLRWSDCEQRHVLY